MSGSEVYVKNAHRQFIKEGDAESSDFFRNANAYSEPSHNDIETSQYDEYGNFIVPPDYKRFRLLVSFNELYTRELLANFHDSATDGFDYGLEAKRPNELNSDACWTQNDEDYVIQAHAFNQDLRIPLVVKAETAQPLAIGIYDVQNFDEEQGIYLYDAHYDIYNDLREQNYLINIEPGHYPNRFEIVFTTDNALSADEVALERLTIKQNNRVHEVQVFNPNGLDISTIELFDLSGRSVIRTAAGSVKAQYKISTQDLSDGVYIATVSTSSDAVKSEKVIIKN
jgi:hypothetical protein